MKVTEQLHDPGQSIWLDNITGELLNSAILQRYISEYSVTGLPPNPTIFQHALNSNAAYDRAIRREFLAGKPVAEVFIELAVEDITQAVDLFRPVHVPTDSLNDRVSLEEFSRAGVDVDMLAADLQREGAAAFEKSRDALMSLRASKIDGFKLTGQSWGAT